MTGDRPPPAEDLPEPTDFDWASPRWREPDAAPGGEQRARRFRDDAAPHQRGAIDAGGSVPSSATGEAPAAEPTDEPSPPDD